MGFLMKTRILKNSGIAWIGEIPKHWEVKKAKYLFKNKKEIVGTRAEFTDRLALTLNGVVKRSKDDNEGLQPKKFESYQTLRKNNLVFKLIDLENISTSRVGISNFDLGIVSPAYIVLQRKENNKFFYYFFMSMYYGCVFNFLGGQGVRSSLNVSDLLNLYLPVPPLNEQERIAEFLDKKCASIDSSIENLEQKIKSLAEYKKALITQCITKGLNPKILEFKDSEIPWIGQIPKHWEIIRLGYICNKLNRKIDENDEPLICSNKGQVAFRDKNACGKMLSENHTMQGIQVGDIAIHGMDTWHGAIAYSNLKGKITGVVHVCDSKENNKFIVYFLQYLAIQGVYKLISNGVRGNTSDFRSWNSVKNIYIIVPPLNEQKEIAEFLDKKCEKIDNLSANYKEQIKTLKEYKKALIYECVTGKKQI